MSLLSLLKITFGGSYMYTYQHLTASVLFLMGHCPFIVNLYTYSTPLDDDFINNATRTCSEFNLISNVTFPLIPPGIFTAIVTAMLKVLLACSWASLIHIAF